MVTCLPSCKSPKKGKQDILGTAGEIRTNSNISPTHEHIVGQPIKTYINQLCADTGCSLEDLSSVMADRGGWQKRIKGIYAVSMP